MRQNIFVLWATGWVWRELISQIRESDWPEKNVNPSKIVWVANSKNYSINPYGIDKKILDAIIQSRKAWLEALEKYWEKLYNLNQLLEIVKALWLEWEVIFADVTAWKKKLLDFHVQVLTESSNKLVTANKNPISLYSMDDFNKLTEEYGRYNTNTTVMGWWWILNFVDERKLINDDILRIEWVFSGTLWYILSELEKWEETFSEIVKNAKEQGYTEPNPMDDLNWLDVARKLIILARYSWHNISIEDVEIEPLIDDSYSGYEWEDFIEAIKNEDDWFTQKVNEAKLKWKVLRYVWEMVYNKDNWNLKLKVWIKSVSKNSDLWNLSWTSNLALVETNILSDPLPHIIKSRWAWLAVTAWAVRVWIASMLADWLPRR